MKKLIAGVICACVLAGCAVQQRPAYVPPAPAVKPPPPPKPPEKTKITFDEFQKVTFYRGINCATSKGDFVNLHAFDRKVRGIRYSVFVSDSYDGPWRHYEYVSDKDGTLMDVSKVAKDVGSCTAYGCKLSESLSFDVTRDYLEKRAAEGFSFKVYGERGSEVFSVAPECIREFLGAVDEHRKQ